MKTRAINHVLPAWGLCLFLLSPLAAQVPAVSMRAFGNTAKAESVEAYTLRNRNGMEAEIITLGGTVVRLTAPDRHGRFADVSLGFDTVADYETKSPYFGALVGRYGNRIAGGQFSLDGKTYHLALNNEPGGIGCTLHGGAAGFDKRVWKAQPLVASDRAGLRLEYLSENGEEGFPGNLRIIVHYWLTDANVFRIEYSLTTDRATPVNLTNHTYFNLAGQGSPTILDHQLQILASHYTPVDAGLIPTGEIAPVKGTPFDFLTAEVIGARISADHPQLVHGGGYDHNWVLDRKGAGLELAAVLREPASGRRMEVWTEEPGLQFYAGNFLDGTLTGNAGTSYAYRSGLCLETQHFPDSPNQSGFPSTILRPGEVRETSTEYRFLLP